MKMAIVVRNDLRLTKGNLINSLYENLEAKNCIFCIGKIGAQCSHAAVIAFKRSFDEKKTLADKWFLLGQPKIVLRVDSLVEIENLEKKAKSLSVISALVKDAGRTQIEPGTVTCIAFGPDYNDRIDEIVKELKLL